MWNSLYHCSCSLFPERPSGDVMCMEPPERQEVDELEGGFGEGIQDQVFKPTVGEANSLEVVTRKKGSKVETACPAGKRCAESTQCK